MRWDFIIYIIILISNDHIFYIGLLYLAHEKLVDGDSVIISGEVALYLNLSIPVIGCTAVGIRSKTIEII